MRISSPPLEPVVPRISVVVASQNARNSISRCLIALESQANKVKAEIIVVDNSSDGTEKIIRADFPHITVIRSVGTSLIPQLWEVGINHSRGEVVAITTAHFVPEKNWIARILNAHERAYAGIGGSIENDPGSGLVSWAIYFCRYSRYMLPFREDAVDDFAADNASYKRSALDSCLGVRRNGFWETFVHSEMRRAGLELLVTPGIVVYHQQSFTFGGFIRQRFQHGKEFGIRRAAHFGFARRAASVLSSPLIPLLYLWRITGRVIAKKRLWDKYAFALPVLVMFLLSWSAGELVGYLNTTKDIDK